MSEKTLVQKLLIKPGYRVIIINAPEGYLSAVGHLPVDASLIEMDTKPADVIQVFVKTLEEVTRNVGSWKQNLKSEGILWITYPKGTSGVKTDLNRDILWQHLKPYHLEGVAMVAVDETWSAMRFKIL
jgi:hypothetical protein